MNRFSLLAAQAVLILLNATVLGHEPLAHGFDAPTFRIQAPAVLKAGTRVVRLTAVQIS